MQCVNYTIADWSVVTVTMCIYYCSAHTVIYCAVGNFLFCAAGRFALTGLGISISMRIFAVILLLLLSGCTHFGIEHPPGDLPKLDVDMVLCDSAEVDLSSREFVLNCTILF